MNLTAVKQQAQVSDNGNVIFSFFFLYLLLLRVREKTAASEL